MTNNYLFAIPSDYKVVLKDSLRKNIYYGLDEYDVKYLKIVQHRYNCKNGFDQIPANVKMEVAPFYWNPEVQMFVLDRQNRIVVQLNGLEYMEEVGVNASL